MISPYVTGSLALPDSTFRVSSGQYVGTTGAATQVSFGFQPTFVIVKGIAGGAADDPYVCYLGMGGFGARGSAFFNPAAIPTNGPITLGATGFGVDSGNAATNTGGATYQYLAIGGATGVDVWTGTYTGNGADGRPIGSTAGADFVMLIRRVTANGFSYRFSSEVGDASFNSTLAASAEIANGIQGMPPIGGTYSFEVGTMASVNGATRVIDWVAIKVPRSGGTCGSYVGTGVSGAAASAAPWTFNPLAALVKGGTATAPLLAIRDAEDSNSVLNNSTANVAGRVQSMPAGELVLGSNVQANQSGVTYHYLALIDT